MHSKDYKNENTKVYKNFFMTSDTDTLIKIAENKGPKNKLIILGISSWGEGQLEGEMERNDWLISEIDKNFSLKIKISYGSFFRQKFSKTMINNWY